MGKETVAYIEDILRFADSPIVWLTGDARSRVLLDLVFEIKRIPVMIFPDFADERRLKSFVERRDLTAYFFSPVEVKIENEVVARYRTDCLEFSLNFSVNDDTPERFERWRKSRKLVPSYLWDTTLTTANVIKRFGKTGIYNPLEDWTDEEIDRWQTSEI